jgi:hypothetical protein
MSNGLYHTDTRAGELAKVGGKKLYKNVLDVLAKTWRNESIRGLQRGLGPAVCKPSIPILYCLIAF